MRLGVKPQARHFPIRNRIVSGLALAVIEATLHSGSLITALLGATSTPIDEIIRSSAFSPAHVTLLLLELELAGRLQRHPGGQVSLAFDE